MVGRTLLKVEGADPVSRVDIRRKLEAMNFAAPVHEDRDGGAGGWLPGRDQSRRR